MPLRQPDSHLVAYQVTVIEVGKGKPQGTIKKNLAGRRLQQIRTAHNFSNSHRCVIDHNGQLVSRHIIPPPNNKISKVPASDHPLWPKMQICETNLLAIPNPKPPIESHR